MNDEKVYFMEKASGEMANPTQSHPRGSWHRCRSWTLARLVDAVVRRLRTTRMKKTQQVQSPRAAIPHITALDTSSSRGRPTAVLHPPPQLSLRGL